MCGFAGIVSFSEPVDPSRVDAMAAAIRHRGPDGTGVFRSGTAVLAAHRLGITDPHGDGVQPFASPDGRLRLVYNGEIYNHRELRRLLEAKGHRFRTDTDTETLLAAYEEWGEQCVDRLEGMWAFALWDRRRGSLFCSRDRFGMRPFYYHAGSGGFAFASEMKAFRELDDIRLRANLEALRDYLEFQFLCHREETFFQGVYSLPPAHNLTLTAEGMKIERYWRLEPTEPPSDPVAAIRERFLQAVSAHTTTEVPVGFCLSGGLDSSSIVGAAKFNQPESVPHTFTATFADRGIEERGFAQTVVDRVQAKPHWVSFSAADLVEDLPRIIRHQDQPFISTSIAAEWFVMKRAAAEGRKVMLDGNGADELLAGYTPLAGFRFADLLAAGQVGELVRELAAYRRLNDTSLTRILAMTLRPFLSPEQEQTLRAAASRSSKWVNQDLRRLPHDFPRSSGTFPDRLRNRLELCVFRLQQGLHSADRNSMAHGVESRLPFLDHRLAEMIFSLGGGALIEKGRSKAVMRHAIGDLLPPEVLHRRTKLSFPTPESRFFREELGVMAADIFASQSFRERGWTNPTACAAHLAAHRRGAVNAGFELWRMLNTELWAREFLDG